MHPSIYTSYTHSQLGELVGLERSFPVAYTFVVYNSPQQILRLLRYLYRPTNFYCIYPGIPLLLVILLLLGLFLRTHSTVKVVSISVPTKVCEVHLSGFRSWNDGVVTTLEPVIPRNCSRLFNRSLHDVTTTIANNCNWKSGLTDLDILCMTSNCSQVAQYKKSSPHSYICFKTLPPA